MNESPGKTTCHEGVTPSRTPPPANQPLLSTEVGISADGAGNRIRSGGMRKGGCVAFNILLIVLVLVPWPAAWGSAAGPVDQTTPTVQNPQEESSHQDWLTPVPEQANLIIAQSFTKDSMMWDKNLPGLDYSSFDQPVADPAYCSNACARDPQCKAWTYVKPGIQGPSSRCWLKYAAPQPQQNSCCVSGKKQQVERQSRKFRMNPMEWNWDRPGMNYNNFDLPYDNPGLCQSECQRDPRCRAWTYVKPGFQGPSPRCWLKGTVPPARKDPCCVSGTKAD